MAALLGGGTALYIRLRWRRAPQAYTAMVAVAVCYFVAGAVLGAWVLHQLGPSAPSSTVEPAESLPTSAPELSSPLPSGAASPMAGVAPGESCGAERWLVKTLDDQDAGKVNLKPVAATVAGLIALAPPTGPLPNNSRVAPVELTTYVVRAVVVERRHEQDHDLHLVSEPLGSAKASAASAICCSRFRGAVEEAGNGQTAFHSDDRGDNRQPAVFDPVRGSGIPSAKEGRACRDH